MTMVLPPPAQRRAAGPLARRPGSSTASVVDLFSGAGGMSCGFHRHAHFTVTGAADAELGKPSSGPGSLDCNASFARNIGITPLGLDLGTVDPDELMERMGLTSSPTVLSACAPCTGFSRTLSRNHLVDDVRNSLVGRVAEFARALSPQVIVMENARELLTGRFLGHFAALRDGLVAMDYVVGKEVHFLSRFGLPQRRERALVVAVKKGLPLLGMDDLWAGLAVRPEATTVRRAIAHLPEIGAGLTHPSDPMHASPGIATELNRKRIAAIPADGGSWVDLLQQPGGRALLTESMKARVAAGKLGSHPDVYGRMAWDRPAATIKRECAHIGNGRYAHPEQNRLLTVREMALLQGFPDDYTFAGSSLTNMYRHVGDAVPPMVAFQMAALVDWILTGVKPEPEALVLPGTSLSVSDLVEI